MDNFLSSLRWLVFPLTEPAVNDDANAAEP
jgi:hypothetical protein